MTGFRKRIGEAGCEFILGLTLVAGLATKTVAKSSLAVVNVDTTVQDKAVTFPTDARLLHKARIALVRLAQRQGIALRQSYECIGRAAFVRSQRYVHARQFDKVRTFYTTVWVKGCAIQRPLQTAPQCHR
jgi:IS5 family transposase